MRMRSVGISLGLAIAALSATARGAGVPVNIECTSLIDIQSYNLGEDASDQAYLMVTGVAGGKAIDERLPKDGAWTAAPKKMPVDAKNPAELWKGDLDNGQFVALTVTLMQGKGADTALNKKFLDELNAADQKVPGYTGATLASADDLKKLAEATLKADQAVITKIKDLYSRDKNTDHYGGQFTLIVWNNNGKLVKRLDPVGLTFGEHYGNDAKVYSKLKNTRNNVLVKNDQGEWEEQQLEPLNDDQTAVRVKELETEMIKQPAGADPLRHTTDYLLEVKVLGPDNKPLVWNAEGEVTGIDNIHTYWPYAD
jgi:hypothetical protein